MTPQMTQFTEFLTPGEKFMLWLRWHANKHSTVSHGTCSSCFQTTAHTCDCRINPAI